MRKELGKIISVNLKHNFALPFVSALGVMVFTLLMCNITALQGRECAKPIEFLLSFTGAMLLIPVFLPEQDKDIRDVILSKKIDYLNICIIRILYSVITMIILVALFIALMKICESDVTVNHLISGIGSAWLLGAVGFAAAGITNNVTIGYMAAILYYIANYGMKDKLGRFCIFPMYITGRFDNGKWLIMEAVVLMIVTMLICRINSRK